MSNTYSTQTRCYALPGWRFDRDEAESLVRKLIDEDDPRSYLVPIVVRLSEDDTVLDVQAGLCDPRFGDQVRHSLDAIWVRRYYDGDDTDWIGRLDDPEPFTQCRYGFDEIRVSLVPGADPAGALPGFPSVGWKPLGGGTWRRSASGTYRVGNDRSVLTTSGPIEVG